MCIFLATIKQWVSSGPFGDESRLDTSHRLVQAENIKEAYEKAHAEYEYASEITITDMLV